MHEFQDRSSLGVGQSHVLVQRNSAGWCIEPSSNRPEFLTWYAISVVSWRDAQSLARERGKRTAVGKDVKRGRGREAHGNPGQVIASRNSVQRPQVAASVSYTSSIKDLIESLSCCFIFRPSLSARSAIFALGPTVENGISIENLLCFYSRPRLYYDHANLEFSNSRNCIKTPVSSGLLDRRTNDRGH